MAIKYVNEFDLKGKRVLARFDFNVPLNEKGEITDTTRIDQTLETINFILDAEVSKLIMMGHLGRPGGKVNPKYSLEPVATYLAQKLGREVILTESAVDCGLKELLSLKQTKIVLLENLRFHPEEEANDKQFCSQLAQLGDIYINDAFGTSHRKHASTYGITAFFPKTAGGGFLLKRELEALINITEKPKRPFIALLGGAKVSDKIKTIERLMTSVDKLLIGGAMAYPFLKAKGYEVGKSLCSDEDVTLAKKVWAHDVGKKILVPLDHVEAKNPEEKQARVTLKQNITADFMGLDIGPATVELYSTHLKTAKTVFWNGPMGLFEKEPFSVGTFAMAKILAQTEAYTFVGGGDSVSAVNKSGLADKFSHISTGGGASLEFIEKGELPGIFALKFGVQP